MTDKKKIPSCTCDMNYVFTKPFIYLIPPNEVAKIDVNDGSWQRFISDDKESRLYPTGGDHEMIIRGVDEEE